jgi:predicted Zn-dependent peptidase
MRRPLAAAFAALGLAACAHQSAPVPSPEAAKLATAPASTTPAPLAAAPQPVPERATIPPLGPAPDLVLPPQQHFRLSNGLAVRLVEYRRLPIVALNLVIDAGGVHDPKAKPGLAGFTAAMLSEGTKRRSSTQISDEVGFLGASLGAGAGFDQASLSASGLSRHLDPLLDLFADVLLHPSFPAADFARVKDQRLVSLVQQRDQPGAIASRAFAGTFWGPHPYGHWLLGTEESVAATTREDLAKFHATWWRPGRAELVVVGDVSREELQAKLERALHAWKGSPPPPAEPAARAAPATRTVLLEKTGAPQAFLILGMPGFERASADYVPAEVAFEILGGGTASRLFRNLREEKGYTYGMYAHPEARKLGGVSVVGGSVKADVTGKALAELLRELQRMREEKPSERELADAKASLVLSLPADFSTAGSIAGKLAEEVIYGLPDDYWTRYVDEVEKVTADDVQRIAAKYLDPSRLVTVMVADPASVKPQLAGLPLGDVEVRPAPAPSTAPRAAGPKPPAAAPQR